MNIPIANYYPEKKKGKARWSYNKMLID